MMTRERALEILKSIQHDGDPEVTHARADMVLCDLLRSLGYQDVVEEWNKVPKWFA